MLRREVSATAEPSLDTELSTPPWRRDTRDLPARFISLIKQEHPMHVREMLDSRRRGMWTFRGKYGPTAVSQGRVFANVAFKIT